MPLGSELLRISPVVTNIIRKLLANVLGHNLTEKERNETFLGLQALGDPPQYFFGSATGSKTVLLLMVLYVYSCMSPITSYFTFLVFGLLAMGLRNQVLFIYPVANDSGGKLWINFQRISVVCMIVAEIILLVLLMSKVAIIAAILLLPLIIMTIEFKVYLDQRHYSVTRYLPMAVCCAIDGNDYNEGVADAPLRDAYLQPALKGGSVFPENYSDIKGMDGRTECNVNVSDILDEDEIPCVVSDDRSDYSDDNWFKKKHHNRRSKDSSRDVVEGMVRRTERNVDVDSDDRSEYSERNRLKKKKEHRNRVRKESSWDEEDVGHNRIDGLDEDVTPYIAGDNGIECLLPEHPDGRTKKKSTTITEAIRARRRDQGGSRNESSIHSSRRIKDSERIDTADRLHRSSRERHSRLDP